MMRLRWSRWNPIFEQILFVALKHHDVFVQIHDGAIYKTIVTCLTTASWNLGMFMHRTYRTHTMVLLGIYSPAPKCFKMYLRWLNDAQWRVLKPVVATNNHLDHVIPCGKLLRTLTCFKNSLVNYRPRDHCQAYVRFSQGICIYVYKYIYI